MKVLITGSCGLVGSEGTIFYCQQGHQTLGIDNNMRMEFFGSQGSVADRRTHLIQSYRNYTHHNTDIRDKKEIASLVRDFKPDLVIHTAAQPSHDWSARDPLSDFEINANGTLNLLEAVRRHATDAVFIFVSSNKVYGDRPNKIKLKETHNRWDYDDDSFRHGIHESVSIDYCLHSPFGASKAAADVMVQEYGRYFKMNTVSFRAGCITGPYHAGVELHGFLSNLVRTASSDRTYSIFGYGGKQVRDQIHASDLIMAFEAFRKDPKAGEVYNIGGGFENSISICECISKLENILGRKIKTNYQPEARLGDHICYYSDLRKFKSHYPGWQISHRLDDIVIGMLGLTKST